MSSLVLVCLFPPHPLFFFVAVLVLFTVVAHGPCSTRAASFGTVSFRSQSSMRCLSETDSASDEEQEPPTVDFLFPALPPCGLFCHFLTPCWWAHTGNGAANASRGALVEKRGLWHLLYPLPLSLSLTLLFLFAHVLCVVCCPLLDRDHCAHRS